jgi:hypothetical protein
MPDPRLATLAVQIETLKARLAKIEETGERLILIREMRLALQEADKIVKDYIEDLIKETAR